MVIKLAKMGCSSYCTDRHVGNRIKYIKVQSRDYCFYQIINRQIRGDSDVVKSIWHRMESWDCHLLKFTQLAFINDFLNCENHNVKFISSDSIFSYLNITITIRKYLLH